MEVAVMAVVGMAVVGMVADMVMQHIIAADTVDMVMVVMEATAVMVGTVTVMVAAGAAAGVAGDWDGVLVG
jgi:hypothetical protein